jgi:ribosomal protein S18 acetylase RimI-like enzyme
MVTQRDLTIEVADTADGELAAAVARLLPQLSSSSAPPTLDELQRIIEDPATALLLAISDDSQGNRSDDGSNGRGGHVVGMLTLAVFLLPTGIRAWIEDVVVDDEARGSGVASALVQAGLERARAQGARTVDLTSRPEREAANRLYVRLGFVSRETNVYRYTLES